MAELAENLVDDAGVRMLLDGLEVESLTELRALVESGRIYAQAVGALIDIDDVAFDPDEIRRQFGPPEPQSRDAVFANFGAAAVRLQGRRERLDLPDLADDEPGALVIFDADELVAVSRELSHSRTLDARSGAVLDDLLTIAEELGVTV